MKRLAQKEIQDLCNAYKTSGSLREIGRKFGRSQNTVRKYVAMHYEINIKNIISNIKTNDELLIGLYVGLWLGDGTQYIYRGRHTIKICSNKNDMLLNTFVCDLLYNLFGKSVRLTEERNTNRAYIIFHSGYIFNYIYNYVQLNGNKTYSARLKGELSSYCDEFLKGCLLGLALSDGSLKEKFIFGVTSKGLALNMKEILHKYEFNPYANVQERANKAIFYVISLSPKESRRLQEFLSSIIKNAGYDYSFNELKYGPGPIRTAGLRHRPKPKAAKAVELSDYQSGAPPDFSGTQKCAPSKLQAHK